MAHKERGLTHPRGRLGSDQEIVVILGDFHQCLHVITVP
jgi:hypothetical protein